MDLSREVAEKVMGWSSFEGAYFDDTRKFVMYNATWNPLEDLNQCFEVVEKLSNCLHFKLSEHGREGRWAALFCHDTWEWSHGDTPNEAILKAALEAVRE